MALYSIGDLIKEFRSRTGATREFLCDETISPETIYRIEIGEHIPQYRVIKTLCARMDIPIPMNIVPLTEVEFRQYKMQTELSERLYTGETGGDFENLLELFSTEFKSELNVFDRQLCFLGKAVLSEQNGELHKAQEWYTQGIQLTVPEFGPHFEFERRKVITELELRLIHGLSKMERAVGDKNLAVRYVHECIAYLNRNTEAKERAALLAPMLMASSAQWLLEDGMYDTALGLAKQGIALCVENDSMRFLKIFSAVQGACLAASGNTAAAEESFALSRACY